MENISYKQIVIVGLIVIVLSMVFLVGCQEEINETIEINETGDNESYFTRGNITSDYFIALNISTVQNVTSQFTIDCSLPEANNYTVEIVFKDAISIKPVEIHFTEFCKRLEDIK